MLQAVAAHLQAHLQPAAATAAETSADYTGVSPGSIPGSPQWLSSTKTAQQPITPANQPGPSSVLEGRGQPFSEARTAEVQVTPLGARGPRPALGISGAHVGAGASELRSPFSSPGGPCPLDLLAMFLHNAQAALLEDGYCWLGPMLTQLEVEALRAAAEAKLADPLQHKLSAAIDPGNTSHSTASQHSTDPHMCPLDQVARGRTAREH